MLGQLALMAINHGTEIADTRCWNTLPQEFELARVFLPEGQHDVKIEVIGPTGVIVDTINRSVKIKAGAKSVVSKRWTAPEGPASHLHPIGGQASTIKEEKKS